MTRDMTHEEAFVLLDAVALDVADRAELDAVLAHVAKCPECRVELVQLRDTAALVAYSLPTSGSRSALDAGRTREKILARLTARAAAGNTGIADRPSVAPLGAAAESAASNRRNNLVNVMAWRRAEWMAVAASMLLVVSVALLASLTRDRQTLRERLAQTTANSRRATTERDSLRTAVMTRDSMIAGLTGPTVAMMTLASAGGKPAFAHMFWDKEHNMWTLVAHNMPELTAGRTYQLWLVTAKGKVSAGTFGAHGGEAMKRAMYPLGPDQLMALAVTEEPMGGMPQPTGPMIIAANAH